MRSEQEKLTRIAGGGARGTIDDFKGLIDDRRERERVADTVRLHFAVN